MGTQPRYRAIVPITVLLIVMLMLLQACGRSDAPATETPRAGGVVVDSEAADAASVLPSESRVATGTTNTTDAAAEAPPEPVYMVGAVITAGMPVTIFATAASSSSVLEVYGVGTPFTVLEPNEQFTAYPVTNGGASWVRVRAADGLAGWAKTDALSN